MTARNPNPPSRYTQCEAYRQAVLDLANETPGITGSEIIRHFGWHSGTANSRLANMCATRELSRKQVDIKVTDINGNIKPLRTYAYTALVQKTISAEDVRRRTEGYVPLEKIKVERMKAVRKPSAESGKTRAPGYYSQKGGGWQANPDSGGQGAIRRRVVIGSVLG